MTMTRQEKYILGCLRARGWFGGFGDEEVLSRIRAILTDAADYRDPVADNCEPWRYPEASASAAIDAITALADRCGWGIDNGDMVSNGKVVGRIEMEGRGVTIWLPKGMRMEVPNASV